MHMASSGAKPIRCVSALHSVCSDHQPVCLPVPADLFAVFLLAFYHVCFGKVYDMPTCFILPQRCFSPSGVQHVRHSSCAQVFLAKEQLSLDVIKQCRVKCPTVVDKQKVLREMIFPNCEKLGQTIIFVRTRETARSLHALVQPLCLLLMLWSACTDH